MVGLTGSTAAQIRPLPYCAKQLKGREAVNLSSQASVVPLLKSALPWSFGPTPLTVSSKANSHTLRTIMPVWPNCTVPGPSALVEIRARRSDPTMSSAMPFRRFAHDVRMLQQQVCSTGAGLK